MSNSTIDDQLKDLIEKGQISPAKKSTAATAPVKAIVKAGPDEDEDGEVEQAEDELDGEADDTAADDATVTDDDDGEADEADEATLEVDADATASDNDTNEPQALVMIYADRCLRCAYLCGPMTKHYDDCHFSNGNEDCPAARTRIVVGINFDKASDALAQAMLENNIQRLTRITAKLADKDEVVQKRVFQLARDKIAKAG